jgi:hypothetical protein
MMAHVSLRCEDSRRGRRSHGVSTGLCGSGRLAAILR